MGGDSHDNSLSGIHSSVGLFFATPNCNHFTTVKSLCQVFLSLKFD
nr:MAG TPA: hypothetical protein [Caudoviricetes sp.]